MTWAEHIISYLLYTEPIWKRASGELWIVGKTRQLMSQDTHSTAYETWWENYLYWHQVSKQRVHNERKQLVQQCKRYHVFAWIQSGFE